MNKVILSAIVLIFSVLISGRCPAQQSIRSEILAEVNSIRREGCKCGNEFMPPASALRWSERLWKAAARHATDMFSKGHLDHIGSDGSTLSDRVNATGYKWSSIGENLSRGYSSPKEVVEGWKSSPGHCRTMMNRAFTDMGAARKGDYWVLDLGSRIP